MPDRSRRRPPPRAVAESADVLYHLLVLWVDAGLRPEQIWAELASREGISGIAEKAAPQGSRTILTRAQRRSCLRTPTKIPLTATPCRSPMAAIVRSTTTATFSPASCAAKSPATKLYEDDFALAFHDIRPQAPGPRPGHPQGQIYLASPISPPWPAPMRSPASSAPSAQIAKQLGVEDTGYRLIANIGPHSHQEVPHFHVHILGGRPAGPAARRAL